MNKRQIGSPGFLLALVSIALMCSWLFFPCCCHHGNARERARRVDCANNLKQIFLGLKMYAEEHDGAYPTNFAAMSSNVADLRELELVEDTRTHVRECTIWACLQPPHAALAVVHQRDEVDRE